MLWLRTTGHSNRNKTEEEKAEAKQGKGAGRTVLSLSHLVWPLTSKVLPCNHHCVARM